MTVLILWCVLMNIDLLTCYNFVTLETTFISTFSRFFSKWNIAISNFIFKTYSYDPGPNANS